jgi:hypothetical protein
MIVRSLPLILLCIALPARAVTVLDVSPLRATPQDMVRMTVHFEQGQRLEMVRTYRYGNSIQTYVALNDVVLPGQPPAPARTETFDIGQFPPGSYQVDIYAGAPTPQLIASYQLGVVAAPAIPATSSIALALLVLSTLIVGFAVVRRRQTELA